MNARRSFYLNSKQDDFATVAGEFRQSDLVDIPFAIPANDNVPVKLGLSARCRALLVYLIPKTREHRTLRTRRNLTLKHGGLLFLLLAGVVGCSLGDWRAAALRFTDLSASQNVALRFPDLSAVQTVALRFPGAKAISAEFVAPAGQPIAPIPASAPGSSLAPHLHLLGLPASPALPPIGHSRFCLRYPHDCQVHGIDFRHRNIAMTPERWKELNDVNRKVNRNIVAKVTSGNGVTEEWLVSPRAGDCKDYAITKQHELLVRGWPSRALLLSEVATPAGEHHLVLVVRVKDADLVLDNLNDDIRLVAMTVGEYDWIRIQSPQNPRFWVRRMPDRMHTVVASD
jgi:predicted transglutaminase-like cysteine proteinase